MTDSQCKFLIVDDHDLMRAFFLKLFSLYELDVDIASNGQEAINNWEKENYRAILMDLEMPVMGGMEATRIIRQREKDEKRIYTPIYAVSGTVMSDPERKCAEAGLDGFIAKPMGIEEVMDVILPLSK